MDAHTHEDWQQGPEGVRTNPRSHRKKNNRRNYHYIKKLRKYFQKSA